uniref:non-specific serine/threonine protein kinase n=1 Tax=Photinus pyralis TaxID=7054 RepID=A0A1Y1LDI8_PHOPY
MSKVNNIIGSRSVSSTSCNSLVSDIEETIDNGLDDLTLTKSNRPSSTTRTTKAKRIRFYHNGNKYFGGVVVPVASDRYRSFDSLTTELTNLLMKTVTLPSGVRTIFSMDGRKISSLEELEDGKEYVCSGKGELFKKIDYTKTEALKNKRASVSKPTVPVSRVVLEDCVRPRIVTIIRNGIKPRKVLRLLLNKRNASNLEQVFSSLTDTAQLDSGAVRKVFTLSGQPVTVLQQFFSGEDVFFVYGNERFSLDDFELEFEESKAIQSYKKTPGLRNGFGPKPKMPKKELKTYISDENLLTKLSKDVNITLPPSLLQKYSVGRMIGDGNFAVVRLCVDKTTNVGHALKIIDKSKCKGKEDMVENEVRILRRLNHPNVMRLVDEQDTKPMLYLVCELVKGGDLFDAITVAQKFSEEQAALMITHLTSALAYLHNLNIVHRDVKPENLLVHMEGSKIKALKLGDFGLACEVTGPLYTVCGTPTYVAPEILAESGYGLKIDVWAAGVILYILLCGYPPFASQDNDQEKLFDCILSGQYDFPDEYWQDVSMYAKELIQNMLQLAPELRFSAEDVLDHPWLHVANC